jgi:hypothetical protein
MVSPTAAMVTEDAAGAARRLTLTAPAVLAPAAQQAGSTSKAADPAIAQHARTVFRMRINLARPLYARDATR